MRRPFRRPFLFLGIALLLVGACSLLSGCAALPGWIGAATQILPMAATAVGGIITVIATALGGSNPGLAVVAGAIANLAKEGQAAIGDLDAMVKEYEANPEPDLLAKIEEASQSAIDHISGLMNDLGAPDPWGHIVQQIGQTVLDELKRWQSILPVISSAQHIGLLHAKAMLASIPQESHPHTAKEFALKINGLLAQSTGDVHLDAALQRAPRLVAR